MTKKYEYTVSMWRKVEIHEFLRCTVTSEKQMTKEEITELACEEHLESHESNWDQDSVDINLDSLDIEDGEVKGS